MRTCKTCGEDKPLEEFYMSKGYRQNKCVGCSAQYQQERPWNKRAFERIRNRAKASGIPFDLTPEDLEMPEHCPILGIRLEQSKGAKTKSSASIDRIVPEMGYVKGNIEIISELANRMKSNATPEELVKFAEEVLRRYKPKG